MEVALPSPPRERLLGEQEGSVGAFSSPPSPQRGPGCDGRCTTAFSGHIQPSALTLLELVLQTRGTWVLEQPLWVVGAAPG